MTQTVLDTITAILLTPGQPHGSAVAIVVVAIVVVAILVISHPGSPTT